MQFVDEVRIAVRGGNGGNGCVAFTREKFNPFGGPCGGDGGAGGSVILRADERLGTLLDLTFRRHIAAQSGEHGRGRDQYGRGGKDEVVRVPVGTQIYDHDTGELLMDLDQNDAEFVVAQGGRGGWGNLHFATPYDRAPRRADPGVPGQARTLRLELKLIADIGIIGFPNVGKSTLISTVSRARPKIADYPFTTLVPNLGVASLGEDRSFVIADIPGIIEGASEGAGLGLQFLRHVERTRALLHVVSVDPTEGREPKHDFNVLSQELKKFSPKLAQKPVIVAMSKMDLPEAREASAAFVRAMKRKKLECYLFSAATGEGVHELLLAMERLILRTPRDAG